MTLPTQQLCGKLGSSVKLPALKELSMRIASGPRWGWAAFAAVCLTACSSQPSSSAPTLAPSTKEPMPALNGSYTFTTDGARLTVDGQPRAGGVVSKTVWEINACGPGCAHVQSSLGWTAELHLVEHTWHATRKLPADCAAEPSIISYSLDAQTLTGTATNSLPCAQPPGVAVVPATLTKN